MLIVSMAFRGTVIAATAASLWNPSPSRKDRGHPARLDSATVAVVPFVVDPADTLLAPLSYCMPDLLTTDLARSRQIKLVEHARLATILRELDLAREAGVQQAGAPRVGRLMQASRLVTGSIRRIDANTILFEAQVNDVESGRVLQAVSGTAPLNDLLIAEKRVALLIFDALGVILTPQERALVDQMPTRNIAALLAYGQAIKAEVNGQYALAMRQFRAAQRLDPAFTRVGARQREMQAAQPNFAAATALNQVNRPLESIPTTLTPGLATDPAFPGARATIIVNIQRP